MDGHVHRAAPRDRNGREAGVTEELLVFGRTQYAEPLTERGVAADAARCADGHPGRGSSWSSFPRSAVALDRPRR